MEDMEGTIQHLSDQNDNLQTRCDTLQEQNDKLVLQNNELEKRLHELEKKFEAQFIYQQNTVNTNAIGGSTKALAGVGCEITTTGSAVSNIDPLPQGVISSKSTAENAMVKNTETSSPLWKIIALCLLYKTCSSVISICPDSKNLPKAFSQMSPQSWRAILAEAAIQMPRLKAPQSQCLNEWWGPQQNSWNPAKISIEA